MGMYPSLMGTFSFLAPVLMIGSSLGGASSSSNSLSFHTTHMEDPWILPSSSASSVPVKTDVSLPTTMVACQVNLDHVVDPSPSSLQMDEEDPYVLPAWVVESSHSHNFLDDVFPSDESFLRPCLGLNNLGKSCTIDHISFLSLII